MVLIKVFNLSAGNFENIYDFRRELAMFELAVDRSRPFPAAAVRKEVKRYLFQR
jgi:hypothetical protein